MVQTWSARPFAVRPSDRPSDRPTVRPTVGDRGGPWVAVGFPWGSRGVPVRPPDPWVAAGLPWGSRGVPDRPPDRPTFKKP